MKQILNNISRITLSIMREGRGVGLLLVLLMMAMSPQNVWADGETVVEIMTDDYSTYWVGDDEDGWDELNYTSSYNKEGVSLNFKAQNGNENGGFVTDEGPLEISVAEGYEITKVVLHVVGYYKVNISYLTAPAGSISNDGDATATVSSLPLSCQSLNIGMSGEYNVLQIDKVTVTYKAVANAEQNSKPDITVSTTAVSSCAEGHSYVLKNKVENKWLIVNGDGKLAVTDVAPTSGASSTYIFTALTGNRLDVELDNLKDPFAGVNVGGGETNMQLAPKRRAVAQDPTLQIYDRNSKLIVCYNGVVSFTASTDHANTQWYAYEVVSVGDLNNDGKLTIADVTQLIQLLNQGGTITNQAADVNGDGNVTVADVEALKKMVLGIDPNLIVGKFSVSKNKKVQFTKGNLYYSSTDDQYHLEPEQNVTYATLGQTTYTTEHVTHFLWYDKVAFEKGDNEPWSNVLCSLTYYSVNDTLFCGEKNKMTVDGTDGLYVLSGNGQEWDYLLEGRTNASNLNKCGVTVTTNAGTVEKCLVLAPDGYSGTIADSYNATEWAAAEAQGLVCLPAGGYRYDNDLKSVTGHEAAYWLSSPSSTDVFNAWYVTWGTTPTSDTMGRTTPFCIRLVKTVE